MFLFVVMASAVPCLFLAAHHARPSAFKANELPLFMGRMRHFTHLEFALFAEHAFPVMKGFEN
jgi:hypothetical protein